MTTAQLKLARITGHSVYVYLPYEGGRGWAEVLEERATPEPGRPGATVRIRFLPGEAPDVVYVRERLVRPADVIKARDEADLVRS